MTIKKFTFNEVSVLLCLAIPLIITGFIEASVGFFSTFFLAHLGPEELAAGAVVSWLFFTLMVILWGTLCSISILVAQKHGAKDKDAIGQLLQSGLMLATLFVIPATLLLSNIGPILTMAKQDPTTIRLAEQYMRGLIWCFWPDFTSIALMQFLMGLGHIRTNLFFSVLWVPLNILTNYAFMFGKFGFPALGMAGIGWGTTIAYWVSTIILIVYLLSRREYRQYFDTFVYAKFLKRMKELISLGVPMGLMYCIEIGFFLLLTLLMGRISSSVLAANQIVLQYLTQLSVVTFSIAQAVTIRIGHEVGAGEIGRAKRAAYIGLMVGVIFSVAVMICYVMYPYQLIEFDLNAHTLNSYKIFVSAKTFLWISGIFLILEAIRVILFGALRGIKDTRFTLYTAMIGFWLVGFPAGYVLDYQLQMGGVGLWWGLVLGAASSVILLSLRFYSKIKSLELKQQLKLK